jgi:hypothetical protein
LSPGGDLSPGARVSPGAAFPPWQRLRAVAGGEPPAPLPATSAAGQEVTEMATAPRALA